MVRHARLLFLASSLLWACGGDRSASVSLNQAIGPEGGTVAAPGGEISLKIPPGALEVQTAISIKQLDRSLPAGGVPGTAFELKPDGLTFAKPVELTLSYAPGSLPKKDSTWLRVVQVLDDGTIAPTRFVAHQESDKTVTATLSHFSSYALADLQLAAAVIKTVKKKVTDVDVLFVIDNSGSMAQEQQNLADNFPRFIKALEAAQMGYRVGVVSSDLGAGSFGLPSCEASGGDLGRLQSAPRLVGCTPPTDPWIEKSAGGTNVTDPAAAFSCIAQLGTGGCGFEQPLEAAHLALQAKTNPGFLRPDAALAVVYISDEDDCSAKDTALYDPANEKLGPLTSFRCFEYGVSCDVNGSQPGVRTNCEPQQGGYLQPVQRYIDQLTGLKTDGAVMVTAIAGSRGQVNVKLDGANPSLAPSCQTVNGFATPPIRIGALVDAFGPQGKMLNICDSDFGPALDALGKLVVEQTQLSWCLPYDPVDTDPSTPALEGDCVVVAKSAGLLPSCAAAPGAPCYEVSRATVCSASSASIALRNMTPADAGDEIYAICLAN